MITWLVLVGGLLGGGLALLASELRPAPPELASTLERLHRPPGASAAAATDAGAVRPLDRLGARLAVLSWVRLPKRQLALVGRTASRFMAYKLVFALIGLVAAPYTVLMARLLGWQLGWTLPALASLACAAAFWFVPDVLLRGEAKEATAEYLHSIAAYYELVALERASDAGPAEALLRAASIGRGTAFRRIAAALERAVLDRRPPWAGLDDLAEELGLLPLQDLADIMRLSGSDGAAVYTTLRARARNLRAELLTEELARANVDSERMVVPGSVLVTLMTLLIAFPAVFQMFHGG